MIASIQVLMLPDYRRDNPYQSLLVNALDQEGINVEFPRGYRRVFPIFRATLETSIPCSVVHLHWISPYLKGKFGLIKVIYALKLFIDLSLVRFRGIKIVWTVHNQISHDSVFPRLEIWTRRVLAYLAHRIILHHDSMTSLIAHEYRCSKNKIDIVNIGHYRDIYPPSMSAIEARKILNLPSTGLIYLHQGIIRPYKGVENLIRAWQAFNAEVQEHILVIAGRPLDNEYALKLQGLAQSVQGLCFRLEFVENKLMSLLFSAADVVVLPFEKILTSSSLLVAMSFGKPVIAPKLGGIPEVLGKANALLYNPEEPNALIQAMQKSTEIDLEELSRLTIQECDRLGWEEIAIKTKQVYLS